MVEVNQLLEQERVASEMLGEEKRAHASVLSELERVSSVSLWRVCVCVSMCMQICVRILLIRDATTQTNKQTNKHTYIHAHT